MNTDQEMFYNYILDKVSDKNKEKIDLILSECFLKQENGTFNDEYLDKIKLEILNLIEPKHVIEVKKVMDNFKI